MKRWLWGLMAVACLTLFAPAPVGAVTCGELTPEARVERAEVVAYGSVLKVTQGTADTKYTIMLHQLYKGEPPNPVTVYTDGGATVQSDSGYHMVRRSDHTLYLVRLADGRYFTGVCDGSHPGEPTAEERRVLGQGRVAPGQPEPFRFWIPWIALGVAGGAIGLVLLSRRK